MKTTEMSTRKFNYRKWKIPIITLFIAIMTLVSLFVVIPYAFGDRFVSCSFELEFISGPGHPGMEVVYVNGSIVLVMFVYPKSNVTNSYFMPVHIHYNGFRDVMLVYNHTVDDPADIVANKEWLVWGGFHHGWSYESFESETNYDYYIARRNLSSYTQTVPVQPRKLGGNAFYAPMVGAVWMGQDMSGNPVFPETYYIYCIVYGIVSKPVNLTVTSIIWTK